MSPLNTQGLAIARLGQLDISKLDHYAIYTRRFTPQAFQPLGSAFGDAPGELPQRGTRQLTGARVPTCAVRLRRLTEYQPFDVFCFTPFG